jgi:hypothetical protein
MSSMTRPRFWLLAAGAVSALWITLGVVTVGAAPPVRSPAEAQVTPPLEIPDPALDALIRRFAREAATRR